MVTVIPVPSDDAAGWRSRALRHQHGARARAEGRDPDDGTDQSDPGGEMWIIAAESTGRGPTDADAATDWVWCLPADDGVVLGDLAMSDPDDVPALWRALAALAADRGWPRITVTTFRDDPVTTALAEQVATIRLATRMQLPVAEAADPAGVELRPMEAAHYRRFHRRPADLYASELLGSGAVPDAVTAQRSAAEAMAHLLPDGLGTAGHLLLSAHAITPTEQADPAGRACEQTIVGEVWIALQPHRAFLYDIMVRPELRGAGWGPRCCGRRPRSPAGTAAPSWRSTSSAPTPVPGGCTSGPVSSPPRPTGRSSWRPGRRWQNPSALDSPQALSSVVAVIVISKPYTRTGDAGQTRLSDMSHAPKTDPRVAAYGEVDEANAAIGLVVTTPDCPEAIAAVLTHIQNELFDVGADLSTPLVADPEIEPLRITEEAVTRLEHWCDEFGEGMPVLRSFVLPGGTRTAAALHLARTVTRRAERAGWVAAETYGTDTAADKATPGGVNPVALRYLNRLSDLLFVMSRAANRGSDEVLWVPGGERNPGTPSTDPASA